MRLRRYEYDLLHCIVMHHTECERGGREREWVAISFHIIPYDFMGVRKYEKVTVQDANRHIHFEKMKCSYAYMMPMVHQTVRLKKLSRRRKTRVEERLQYTMASLSATTYSIPQPDDTVAPHLHLRLHHLAQ
jgi:hypothetical protein